MGTEFCYFSNVIVRELSRLPYMHNNVILLDNHDGRKVHNKKSITSNTYVFNFFNHTVTSIMLPLFTSKTDSSTHPMSVAKG